MTTPHLAPANEAPLAGLLVSSSPFFQMQTRGTHLRSKCFLFNPASSKPCPRPPHKRLLLLLHSAVNPQHTPSKMTRGGCTRCEIQQLPCDLGEPVCSSCWATKDPGIRDSCNIKQTYALALISHELASLEGLLDTSLNSAIQTPITPHMQSVARMRIEQLKVQQKELEDLIALGSSHR
ncbi:hypothetical protein BKA70DRAFT_1267782 [Coprinopsis sp. MPI-PUGE-AT-0042]|nr:hypothetical protein BKA70DRAFT_1267782 [Coprinopsis sp. MPI-PUGE-AT-0042]